MIYTLVYLVNDQVSWTYDSITDHDLKRRCIIYNKQMTSARGMCEGHAEFLAPILELIESYGYDEEPDYDLIIRMFVSALIELDYPP